MAKISFYHNYNRDERVIFLFEENLKNHFVNGKWGKLEIDHNNYDFLICFNDAPPVVSDNKKIICLNIEPPWSSYYSDRNDSFFFKTKRAVDKIGWVIHNGMSYLELSKIQVTKNKEASVFCSKNSDSFEQVIRQDFCKELPPSIDKFGFGYNSVPINKKYIGLLDYKYTIAFENHIENYHCTEKLPDSILTETLCFYWGAPNVSEIYDERSYIQLDLTDFKQSIKDIKDHLRLNSYRDRKEFLIREKKRILNEEHLAPTIHNIIYGNTK